MDTCKLGIYSYSGSKMNKDAPEFIPGNASHGYPEYYGSRKQKNNISSKSQFVTKDMRTRVPTSQSNSQKSFVMPSVIRGVDSGKSYVVKSADRELPTVYMRYTPSHSQPLEYDRYAYQFGTLNDPPISVSQHLTSDHVPYAMLHHRSNHQSHKSSTKISFPNHMVLSTAPMAVAPSPISIAPTPKINVPTNVPNSSGIIGSTVPASTHSAKFSNLSSQVPFSPDASLVRSDASNPSSGASLKSLQFPASSPPLSTASSKISNTQSKVSVFLSQAAIQPAPNYVSAPQILNPDSKDELQPLKPTDSSSTPAVAVPHHSSLLSLATFAAATQVSEIHISSSNAKTSEYKSEVESPQLGPSLVYFSPENLEISSEVSPPEEGHILSQTDGFVSEVCISKSETSVVADIEEHKMEKSLRESESEIEKNEEGLPADVQQFLGTFAISIEKNEMSGESCESFELQDDISRIKISAMLKLRYVDPVNTMVPTSLIGTGFCGYPSIKKQNWRGDDIEFIDVWRRDIETKRTETCDGVAKYVTTENSWAARQQKLKSDAQQQNERRMRALLNKVTAKSCSSLYQQFISDKIIMEKNDLHTFIKLIFAKATTQHQIIPVYVNFCKLLENDIASLDIKEIKTKKDYTHAVCNMCEEIFKSKLNMGFKQDPELTEDENFEKYQRYKREFKGNVMFVCELARHKMLSWRTLTTMAGELTKEPFLEHHIDGLLTLLKEGKTVLVGNIQSKTQLLELMKTCDKMTKDEITLGLRLKCLMQEELDKLKKLCPAVGAGGKINITTFSESTPSCEKNKDKGKKKASKYHQNSMLTENEKRKSKANE